MKTLALAFLLAVPTSDAQSQSIPAYPVGADFTGLDSGPYRIPGGSKIILVISEDKWGRPNDQFSQAIVEY